MSEDRYEGLPDAVRRQAEEADRKIADMAKQIPPAPAEPAEPPANEPPAEPQPPEDPTPVDPPQEPVQPAVEPQAPPVPPHSAEDWKQKFVTLQGKYNAEIPRLHDEIRGLRALVSEQTRQLTESLRQMPTGQPPADPNAPPKRRFVTDEDEQALGPELAAQQDKVLARAIDPVQNELKSTRTAIEQMNKRLFFSDLSEAIPNWRDINKNDQFLEWLGEPDPMDPRRTRDDALKSASERKDAETVASIFSLFVSTHPDVLKPPAEGGEPRQPSIPRREDLVQPPRQRGSPPATPAKKTWKTSEIAQFAKEISRKLWDARPQEAARIQSEIDLALREGRVVKD